MITHQFNKNNGQLNGTEDEVKNMLQFDNLVNLAGKEVEEDAII